MCILVHGRVDIYIYIYIYTALALCEYILAQCHTATLCGVDTYGVAIDHDNGNTLTQYGAVLVCA